MSETDSETFVMTLNARLEYELSFRMDSESERESERGRDSGGGGEEGERRRDVRERPGRTARNLSARQHPAPMTARRRQQLPSSEGDFPAMSDVTPSPSPQFPPTSLPSRYLPYYRYAKRKKEKK